MYSLILQLRWPKWRSQEAAVPHHRNTHLQCWPVSTPAQTNEALRQAHGPSKSQLNAFGGDLNSASTRKVCATIVLIFGAGFGVFWECPWLHRWYLACLFFLPHPPFFHSAPRGPWFCDWLWAEAVGRNASRPREVWSGGSTLFLLSVARAPGPPHSRHSQGVPGRCIWSGHWFSGGQSIGQDLSHYRIQETLITGVWWPYICVWWGIKKCV